MLDVFRRHSSGIVAKIILALIILSFAAWGIGDMLSTKARHVEVARVGKTSFSANDVNREMQNDIQRLRTQLGKNYNPNFIKQLQLPEQVVGRMVGQEMMRQEIADLGIVINDRIVAEMIHRNPSFADKNGKFSKEYFLQTLKQHGVTEKDYTAGIKREMASRLLSQAVVGSGDVPDIAVNVMLAAQAEKRTIDLYKINLSGVKVGDPTEKELQEYYTSVSDRYAIPEYRTVRYVTLDESLVKNVQVTEAELQQAYEERKAEFDLPETRSFEQLLYTEQADAEKAAKLLKSGKALKVVAKEVPPINAGNTAIKGVTSNAMPEEIRAAAFTLANNEVSAPIKSSFGYHVLMLTEMNPAHMKTLDEAKEQLENDLKPQKINDALTKLAHQLEDSLAGGASLAEVAKEMGLSVQSFGPFDKMGRAPDKTKLAIPPLTNFATLAFATEEGVDSVATLGKAGTYYLLHVDKVEAEKLPDISSVKSELVASWRESRKATLERNLAEEIAGKFADEKQRADLIKSGAITPNGSGNINRSDIKLDGKELSAMLVQDIFSTSIGATTNPQMLSNGSYVLALVRASTMPKLLDRSELLASADASALRASMQTNMQQELMSQYMDSLGDKFGVEIHKDVVTQMSAEEEQ
jgi:peptidyl-prolyl cis-trans isomerase D